MSEYCKYYLTKSLYKLSSLFIVLFIVFEVAIPPLELPKIFSTVFAFSLNEIYFNEELKHRKEKIRALKKNK